MLKLLISKHQWGGSILSKLNPMNWGVEDFSNEKSHSSAYAKAKHKGLDEFMFKNNRYNTKYAGTPYQEVKTYGVNGKKMDDKTINNAVQLQQFAPIKSRYLPGHISAGYNLGEDDSSLSVSVDYGPRGNSNYWSPSIATSKSSKVYNVYKADKNKLLDKAVQLKDRNDWNLMTNNCADAVCDAFSIPRSKGITTPWGAVDKVKSKYPTLDITGRGIGDYYDKIQELGKMSRENPDEFFKKFKEMDLLYKSPELKSRGLHYSLVNSLQTALDKKGFPLNKSWISDGEYGKEFDSLMGPETQSALDRVLKNPHGNPNLVAKQSFKRTLTPITKRQTGGEIKQYYKQYITSPNYKKRLVTQGHQNPDQIIRDRLYNLNGIKEVPVNTGNEYVAKTNKVHVDKSEIKEYNLNAGSLKAHEYSHGVGALMTKKDNIPSSLQLNKNEINQLEGRNLLRKQPEPTKLEDWANWIHDTRGNEIKADLDALRFRLKKDGLYDTGTQQFNKQLLDKSKVRYKKDMVVDRLMKAYPSKDLIYLMNNIAKVDNGVTDQSNMV